MPPRNQPPPSPPSPARFYFSPGSFDFPEASALPPPTPAARARALMSFDVHHVANNILGRHARQERDQRVTSERERTESPRRRQSGRAIPRHAEREPDSTSVSRRGSTTAGRPRATPSEQYLRRSHARLRDHRSADTDSLPDMADENTSVLDGPRQPKRRKLDHDPSPISEHRYYKYGREGQTVSGKLKMEIVSCDGGEYVNDYSDTERLYKVQNVLSNDKSVYCSQSSRCNLLLKHLPDVPFSLEKVVIRAPNRGFTAPVQEGLIFVTMTPDNILSGTAGYHLEYSPRSPALSPILSDHDDELLSLREALEDPAWMRSRQAALQDRIDRLRQRRGRLQTEMAERDRARENRRSPSAEDEPTEYCPYHVDDGGATAIGVSAPTPPPFTITTESAQEESDENDTLPSAAVMADRMRRESRWRQDSDDNDDDDDSDEDYGSRYPFPPLGRRAQAFELANGPNFSSIRSIHPLRRAAPLRAPSRIERRKDRSQSEEPLEPHARFFIARHKNKITIKFHPAISGKYVLLKLWSPMYDGNIDIESVQFYGYGGQRFFPATQPC